MPEINLNRKNTYNFSAGPSGIPTEVLEIAQSELLNFQGHGMSIMEMSHRSKTFEKILHQTFDDFKTLLNIPNTHEVLFMQGGAIAENAIIPLNLLNSPKQIASYAITGSWSAKSYQEAMRYGDVEQVCNASPYSQIIAVKDWKINSNSQYLHYCSNETIDGIAFNAVKEQIKIHHSQASSVELVADMSSDILSKQINVADFGVIYGGAQKNIGPSGLTFVIVKKTLLGKQHTLCPSAFNWSVVANNDSMYNTPPTFAIYLAGLIFKHYLAKGGIASIEANNQAKAKLLYDYIDQSNFYSNAIASDYRSLMNIPFTLKNEQWNDLFLQNAHKEGLVGLKGHKSVGGMRASLYNAMPLKGVETLVAFMQNFAKFAENFK
jgi:phosphoserine aminotransferase